MSRVGKKPIPLPKGVKITIGERVAGGRAQGQTDGSDSGGHHASAERRHARSPQRDGDDQAALHGLTRALAANAVQGVSTGFTRELDIVGIGYRCDVKGRIATFTLGYSHPIEFYLPDGIDMKIDKQNNLPLSDRLRPATAGPGGGEHARAASARSVQEQGRPLHRRSAAQEGRQDRCGGRRQVSMDHGILKTSSACAFISASAASVAGTPERPRLAVFRSVKHIYAQVIDDSQGHTVVAASSNEKTDAKKRRQRGRRQGDRQAGGRARQGQGHQGAWCSTAAGICITAA